LPALRAIIDVKYLVKGDGRERSLGRKGRQMRKREKISARWQVGSRTLQAGTKLCVSYTTDGKKVRLKKLKAKRKSGGCVRQKESWQQGRLGQTAPEVS